MIQIIAQKKGDDVMWFFYDANGTRIGMYYNGTTYYYLYNVQGDVVALARAYNGKIVAKYSYDAWGNCTVTNASGTTIGDINPFRYRGYYYDTESGFYYLNSRYYSSEFGRFISADTTAVVAVSPDSANYDKNLFAYCDNNPVCRKDDGGALWNFAVGAVAGALIGGGAQIFGNIISGSTWSRGLGMAMATGAVSGLIAASGAGLVGSIAKNAASSMIGNAITQINGNKGLRDFDVGYMLIDGAIGGISGAIGGSGMGKSVNLVKLNKQLTNKVFSGSAKIAKQGVKYYMSQTKTLYKNFLINPMITAGKASAVLLSVKGLATE